MGPLQWTILFSVHGGAFVFPQNSEKLVFHSNFFVGKVSTNGGAAKQHKKIQSVHDCAKLEIIFGAPSSWTLVQKKVRPCGQ
jgi:hypothetical protein